MYRPYNSSVLVVNMKSFVKNMETHLGYKIVAKSNKPKYNTK